MPQMSPYNWLMLFTYFNIIMMFIITLMNYMYLPNFKKNINYNMYTYKWKW